MFEKWSEDDFDICESYDGEFNLQTVAHIRACYAEIDRLTKQVEVVRKAAEVLEEVRKATLILGGNPNGQTIRETVNATLSACRSAGIMP